jgi:hypothetical protein
MRARTICAVKRERRMERWRTLARQSIEHCRNSAVAHRQTSISSDTHSGGVATAQNNSQLQVTLRNDKKEPRVVAASSRKGAGSSPAGSSMSCGPVAQSGERLVYRGGGRGESFPASLAENFGRKKCAAGEAKQIIITASAKERFAWRMPRNPRRATMFVWRWPSTGLGLTTICSRWRGSNRTRRQCPRLDPARS